MSKRTQFDPWGPGLALAALFAIAIVLFGPPWAWGQTPPEFSWENALEKASGPPDDECIRREGLPVSPEDYPGLTLSREDRNWLEAIGPVVFVALDERDQLPGPAEFESVLRWWEWASVRLSERGIENPPGIIGRYRAPSGPAVPRNPLNLAESYVRKVALGEAVPGHLTHGQNGWSCVYPGARATLAQRWAVLYAEESGAGNFRSDSRLAEACQCIRGIQPPPPPPPPGPDPDPDPPPPPPMPDPPPVQTCQPGESCRPPCPECPGFPEECGELADLVELHARQLELTREMVDKACIAALPDGTWRQVDNGRYCKRPPKWLERQVAKTEAMLLEAREECRRAQSRFVPGTPSTGKLEIELTEGSEER